MVDKVLQINKMVALFDNSEKYLSLYHYLYLLHSQCHVLVIFAFKTECIEILNVTKEPQKVLVIGEVRSRLDLTPIYMCCVSFKDFELNARNEANSIGYKVSLKSYKVCSKRLS